MEPMGRGDEPQVRITVTNKAFLPATRQAKSCFKTVISMFSIFSILYSYLDKGSSMLNPVLF